MVIVEIIQYILALIFGLILAYQLLLSLIALTGKRILDFATHRKRKFAIVLHTHNKEKAISGSLYSMSGFVYPKNMYDLIVVADNCTDNSAQVARSLGAIVLERTDTKKRGKGYALKWAFDQILQWDKQYEAIIIFDSDSYVSGNYLEVMNYYLEKGSEVIQGSDLPIQKSGEWNSQAAGFGFILDRHLKPMGKKVLGFDMRFYGSGVCISIDILHRLPELIWSLKKEVEFGLRLLLDGVKIDFAPEACVWTQKTSNLKNGDPEFKQWKVDGYTTIRKYAPKLLVASIRKRSFRYLDTLIDLITPPLYKIFIYATILSGLNAVLWIMNILPITFLWLWASIILLGGMHFPLVFLSEGQIVKCIRYYVQALS